jgi:hypothetical protein
MSYVPQNLGASKTIKRVYRPRAYAPAENMGGIFGDVFAGIENVVSQTVAASVATAKKALVTTAQQEASAAMSKAAIIALQKKKQPAKRAPVLPTEATDMETEAPAFQDNSQKTVIGAQTTTPQIPATETLMKYAPYAIAIVGGTILVIMIARRKK